MDPNITINRLRELASQVRADMDGDGSIDDCQNVAFEFATLITSLDDWIMRGGPPPVSWSLSLAQLYRSKHFRS